MSYTRSIQMNWQHTHTTFVRLFNSEHVEYNVSLIAHITKKRLFTSTLSHYHDAVSEMLFIAFYALMKESYIYINIFMTRIKNETNMALVNIDP